MEDLISAIGASEAALLMVSCCIMGRPWAPVPSTAINISKKLIACRDGNQQILWNPMKPYGLFVSFCWVDESINKRSFAIKQVVIASCSTNMCSLCSMCIYILPRGFFVIFCWAFKQENTFNAMCHDNYPGDIFEPVDACWLLTWRDFFGKSALAYRLLSFLRIRKAKCAPKVRHAGKNDSPWGACAGVHVPWLGWCPSQGVRASLATSLVFLSFFPPPSLSPWGACAGVHVPLTWVVS